MVFGEPYERIVPLQRHHNSQVEDRCHTAPRGHSSHLSLHRPVSCSLQLSQRTSSGGASLSKGQQTQLWGGLVVFFHGVSQCRQTEKLREAVNLAL